MYSLSTNYFEKGVHSGNAETQKAEKLKYYDYRFTVPLLSYNSSTFYTYVNVSQLNALDVHHLPISEKNFNGNPTVMMGINWQRICNVHKETYAS